MGALEKINAKLRSHNLELEADLAPSVAIFLHLRLRFLVAGENRSDYLTPRSLVPPPPKKKPCDFSLRRKIAGDPDSFCDFPRKKRSHADDGDVCNKKRDAWRLRFLVLSDSDPPILVFFCWKKQGKPRKKKSKGFSLRGTPDILGKERQNAPRKQGKNKKKQNYKTNKDWRVRGVEADLASKMAAPEMTSKGVQCDITNTEVIGISSRVSSQSCSADGVLEAVRQCNLAHLRAILQTYPSEELNATTEDEGMSALHLAARAGHVEAARLLLGSEKFSAVNSHTSAKRHGYRETQKPIDRRKTPRKVHLNFHRVLQGALPRGRQLYFTFPSATDLLFKTSKAHVLTLQVATP